MEDASELVELLRQMPLTALGFSSVELPMWRLLHHLPQLRELTCSNVHGDLAASIAAAPQLQKLGFGGHGTFKEVESVARQWWRRLGCPPLSIDGRVDQTEWQKHLQQTEKAAETKVCRLSTESERNMDASPVLLRELVIKFPLDGTASTILFPYLAHLPNLRVLECSLSSAHFPALGLLLQLEKLRLWPGWVNGRHGYSEQESWSDAGLQALGSLPLPWLRTLCLCAANERGAVFTDRARVTLIGLRALLQLPALTALGLPWIRKAVLAEICQVKQQQGRASLLVDRFMPGELLPRVEQQWLDVSQIRMAPMAEFYFDF